MEIDRQIDIDISLMTSSDACDARSAGQQLYKRVPESGGHVQHIQACVPHQSSNIAVLYGHSVKKGSDIPVPSRDVTSKTHHGLGTRMSLTFLLRCRELVRPF